MNRPQATPMPAGSAGETLRDALARGDAVIGKIAPILGHLLSTQDHSLYSDEIVARVRGMLHDLAFQILRNQAEATGHAGREEFAARHAGELAEHFQSSVALLRHCHALALEWQFAQRIEGLYALDPVLSPLVQQLIASPDSAIASAAMAALAAQARFAQTQRRMELPLRELPGDLLHETLLSWRAFNGDKRSDALTRAEAKVRDNFDEGEGRLALFARLIASMGRETDDGLSIDRAGTAIFLSALAALSGQSRELAAIATHEQQSARLALGLRAAELSAHTIEAQLLRIHPGADPLRGLDEVSSAEARQMLSAHADQGIA